MRILYVGPDSREAAALAAMFAADCRIDYCAAAGQLPAAKATERPDVVLYADRFEALDLRPFAQALGWPPILAIADERDALPFGPPCTGVTAYIERPLSAARIEAALTVLSGGPLHEECPVGYRSPAARRILTLIERYAAYEFPVLILGESGTGKELAARRIHARSARHRGPFVALNCAAIPEELAESELFGSERGAFTGAVQRPGAFELAEGGTLFLDEIGETGASAQAKLLRALESGEFRRLGGSALRKANVRLVAATSRDIRSPGNASHFRPDLLYRIETLVLELPPLRERREDIADLAETFAREASHGWKGFSGAALELLAAQPWPGNVRQLKNVVLRAIVLSDGCPEIGPEHIFL